ncbi:MAG: HlyD family efflux transporter periplasmic adaptor subunit [Edaphobacter sp.]
MNLAEALTAALPDLPARRNRTTYPRLDPEAIARKNVEDGEPVIVVLLRGTDRLYRFSPEQWRLVELFDGIRSYEEIAALHRELYGVVYGVNDLKEYASGLADVEFWYRTPLEKSIALRQKLESSRHQHTHRKSKWGDVAHMQFSAWDPDRYFNRIYPYTKWIYTGWFTTLTLLLFACMVLLSAANWTQIQQDTVQFYNFTQKSGVDLAQFWIIFLILGFFHESAHGLTCKHYGAEVHSMGFHLIYLTPAFFVDVSEAWVYASRWQRLVTIIAGVWVEMIFCAIATIVWWGTPPGSDAHNIAYMFMMLTGLAVVVINMNPLIKLDGYYAFSEVIGFSDIKEKSTAYLSGLVRGKIFQLPVEMDFVPRRRRVPFVVYAVLSGIYSYGLLYTVVRFSYNVFFKYSPQWAFLPALILALIIFRSRIRTFLRFVQTVYLDKKDRVRSWLGTSRAAITVCILLVLLFAPLWQETVRAKFVLEPSRREVVRTIVPGRVTAVFVREGQTVAAGEPLIRMENVQVRSRGAVAQEDFAMTGLQGVQAQLSHADQSSVLQEHRRAGVERAVAQEEADKLRPRAPIAGTVMTARLPDLEGSYLDAGTTVAEIGETSQMRARIYVLEYAVPRVRLGATVHLLPDGWFSSIPARIDKLEPAPEGLDTVPEGGGKTEGGHTLNYYVADALLANDGSLREGMTGIAKIAVRNRSIAGILLREIREFVQRKVW